MEQNILITFPKKKEAEQFVLEAKKVLMDKKYSKNYIEYITVPGWRWFKSFLYVLGGAVLTGLSLWFILYVFSTKPEPRVIINTVTVTGNTYEVTLDTKKLPALGSLVYYYNSEISIRSGAKFNSIHIDADGVTRFNICTAAEVDCAASIVNDGERRCIKPIYDYVDCFNTTIIGSTEQELKDGICNV